MIGLNAYIAAHAAGVPVGHDMRTYADAQVFLSAAILDETPGVVLGASEAGSAIQIQVAQLDVGRMALFYASKEDRRLSEHFAGMTLARAADMVCQSPDLDGLLIQSSGDAWIVAPKAMLSTVMK